MHRIIGHFLAALFMLALLRSTGVARVPPRAGTLPARVEESEIATKLQGFDSYMEQVLKD